MDEITYQNQADAFLTEWMEEEYQVAAGLKEQARLLPIYDRYAGLFEQSTVRDRLAERHSPVGRYLADWAVTGFLERQVWSLSHEIANAERAALLVWDGQEVPLQEVPQWLSEEGEHGRRNELARAYHRRLVDLNPLRARRWNQLHRLARELGFDGYVSLHDELRALGLHRLAEGMVWLLDVTEPAFREELHGRLEAQGIAPQDANIWDVAALLRAPELDPLFPADRMIPLLRQTLLGLDMDLGSQPTTGLHLETRPHRLPGSFWFAVRPPADVRLVVRPASGLPCYAAFFHSAGHALQAAHTDKHLPFAYRRLGDTSVGQAYAYLLEGLLTNPAWLEAVMGLTPVQCEAVSRTGRFRRLFLVRRHSASLNYELELHSGLVDAKAGAYVHWLQRGCQVTIPPQQYLRDASEGFRVATHLRAYLFEAQLRRFLESNFGALWFARADVGDFLKGLWLAGQQHPVEELARQTGMPALDVGLLKDDLTSI